MKDNNEQFENFIRDFDTIRMTNYEKSKIKDNLIAFTNTYVPKRSPYYNKILFFKKTFATALIILLIISISKPASAKSLPGDLLYNVKIIHEEIESAMINKPEKKIDFEIKRTKTRIQEAVVLANKNNLDKNKQKKLATDIKKHVKKISENINYIKKDSPEKALALNSDLKTTLKVNSIALKKAVDDNTELTEEKIKTPNDVKNEEYIKDDIIKNEVEKQNNEENIDTENKNIKDSEETQSNKITEEIKSKDDEYTDNIILDSISDDIEKTKVISNTIENEIISNENNDNTEVADSTDLDSNIKKKIDDIETTTLTDENTEEKEIINKEDSENINNINSDFDEIKTNQNNIVNTSTKSEKTEVEDTEISEEIQSEIISLKNVLEAENRLKLLLAEVEKTRDEYELTIIKDYIEKKQLGKAYVKIQKEIEKITEIKLLKELGIDSDDTEIKNNNINTEVNIIKNTEENPIKEEI